MNFEWLVIGYGNTLRGDDAAGPRVAEAIGELHLPGVRTLVCHQLTPELAEDISRAQKVVFVDASADDSSDLQMRELFPVSAPEIMTHATDPASLLALARELFGRAAEAWSLRVAASNFALGEAISPRTQRTALQAVELIGKLVTKAGDVAGKIR